MITFKWWNWHTLDSLYPGAEGTEQWIEEQKRLGNTARKRRRRAAKKRRKKRAKAKKKSHDPKIPKITPLTTLAELAEITRLYDEQRRSKKGVDKSRSNCYSPIIERGHDNDQSTAYRPERDPRAS